MIQDVESGDAIYLDPLELQALCWLRHEDLWPFLDPSFRRWRDPDTAIDINYLLATKNGTSSATPSRRRGSKPAQKTDSD